MGSNVVPLPHCGLWGREGDLAEEFDSPVEMHIARKVKSSTTPQGREDQTSLDIVQPAST